MLRREMEATLLIAVIRFHPKKISQLRTVETDHS